MDCFGANNATCRLTFAVSISALSDRGLLLHRAATRAVCRWCFNIRSFGSWIASSSHTPIANAPNRFQYPLFRIVDCFRVRGVLDGMVTAVSISALSDRGLLPVRAIIDKLGVGCFNIRSFGSWIASAKRRALYRSPPMFQYPLFRIVDCFHPLQVPLLISPKVSISALSDRGLLRRAVPCGCHQASRFNIRSFGSWIASGWDGGKCG